VFEQPTHIYLNPVASDRAGDFEQFLTEVVVPAVRAQRPQLEGRWHVLKADQSAESDGSVAIYAFVFDGGSLEEDWELEDLIPAHYGKDEGQRLLSSWMESFVPLSRWLATLGEEAGPQLGWTFTAIL
jgi:hypothetical protein